MLIGAVELCGPGLLGKIRVHCLGGVNEASEYPQVWKARSIGDCAWLREPPPFSLLVPYRGAPGLVKRT